MNPAYMKPVNRSARELFWVHFRLPGGDPDLDMLRGIISSYSEIPYENITKIIKKFRSPGAGDRLRMPVEVVGGYVERRTGGTCFSLTYCLGSILSDAGFSCHPVMADMKRANIHCALLVHIMGRRFLVDPGYLLSEPVELADGPVTLRTSFGVVELRPRRGDRYDLFTLSGGERKWRYRVKTVPVSRSMFIRYWQESFSLPMMNSIQLTKLTGEGHLYIRNHHMRIAKADGKLNENIRLDFESRIEEEFGIPGSIAADARELLERMRSSWHTKGREGR